MQFLFLYSDVCYSHLSLLYFSFLFYEMRDNNVNEYLPVLLLKGKYFCISRTILPSFRLPFLVSHLSALSALQPSVQSRA